jgi:hypothetical protein
LPYAGKKGECKTTCDEKKKLKSISHCVMRGTKNIKRDILASGPVVIPAPVFSDFLVYSGGIYSHSDAATPVYGSNGKAILQALTILGWGRQGGAKGTEYWLVENSWGKAWGEEGYAKIAVGEVLMEHYVIAGYPETEEAIKRSAEAKVAALERKQEAKKERAERDARIAAAKQARDEAASSAELDDLDEPDADLDIDLDTEAEDELEV